MNVILTLGYDKYVLSIEDAAKVMALMNKATPVNYAWGDESEGTHDRWVECRKTLEIANLTMPVEAA